MSTRSIDQKRVIIFNAIDVLRESGCQKLFLFLNSGREVRWYQKLDIDGKSDIVLVLPDTVDLKDIDLRKEKSRVITCWSGDQTRFSRIKYAFLHAVLQGVIDADSKVVCVLGPSGKNHLDTITIHDLALSWSEEFPFQVRSLIDNEAFYTVMAVIDIALDIGALGREGKPVGTVFVIGDSEQVLENSHQAVFNPFRGYPRKERSLSSSEVVESLKELAQLDGAIIISKNGIVEAAGRNLDVSNVMTKSLRGLGSRHRAAAGITKRTNAVSIVVSETNGRVTIFEGGRVVGTLEPLINRRTI